MSRRVRSLPLSLFVALLGAGCTVGPDYVRPASPTVDRYTAENLSTRTVSADIPGGQEQRFLADLDIQNQWWTLFHCRELDDLVDQAFKASPTLQAAQAALQVAQENVYAQQGAFLPSVSAAFSPSRQKTSGSLTSVPSSGAYLYSLHTAQVSVSFLPDVFGGNRRQVESLQAQADGQRFQVEATYITLATNIVNAAVQAASLRDQIDALERVVALQIEQLEILRKQLELGDIAEVALIEQAASLAQAQAQLPTLRKQLAVQNDLLSALGGRTPAERPLPQFTLASLQLPGELPLILPSKLVEQRPDVRAAEANVHSASAQVGVAIANMLPQFTIDASLGSAATRLPELFTSGTGFWSLAGNIAEPVFDGGTLLHRKRAAEANLDQAVAAYRSAVITAFQNVADTLQALQADADGLRAAVDAENAARKSVDITRRQIELGDVSYLSVLMAEQAYQQALINRVQSQAGRLVDTAALFHALGGGWWNRSEPASIGPRHSTSGSKSTRRSEAASRVDDWPSANGTVAEPTAKPRFAE